MATEKQKAVVDLLVENGRAGNPEPIGKVLVKAGYSPNTAIAPTKVTESQGFKEALEEAGLTPNLVTRALADDIKAKPGKRYQELGLAANILKMTGKESDGGDKNVTINFISFNGHQDVQ